MGRDRKWCLITKVHENCDGEVEAVQQSRTVPHSNEASGQRLSASPSPPTHRELATLPGLRRGKSSTKSDGITHNEQALAPARFAIGGLS
jgi:hypothetical protein